MRLLQILFFTLSTVIYAQNFRFVYEYKMVPDKNKIDSTVINYMNLDTDGNQSYFYNAVKADIDSLNKNGGMKHFLKLKKYDQNLNYEIRKNYDRNEVLMFSSIYGVISKIPEKDKIEWKILDDHKIIGAWKSQKAVTKYKGREWIAWFTNDISINDGPYKFAGLPGLIIELSDKDNHHVFSLIQTKKIDHNFYGFSLKNAKEILPEKYWKIMSDYKVTSNANVDYINVSVSTNTLTIATKDGNQYNMDTSWFKKYEGKQGKIDELIAKNYRISNNPIELIKIIDNK